MKKFILLLAVAMMYFDAFACTSAIITGRLTADGRPLMWKHRDTGELNNRMEWFKGTKYSFLALVNSPDKTGVAWSGSNEVGFSIMNTASFNLKDDDVKEMDMEGVFMFKALGECRNLADFEKFLDKYPRPMRVEAHFAIIDAEGGAAYYEVNNTKWIKVDVNDKRIAPHGYLVYTNFAYTGRVDEGLGYIRFNTADMILRSKSVFGGITPQWIVNSLSRTFYNSLMDIDMAKVAEMGSGWITDTDYIPRKSSASAIVFQGVKQGDKANATIAWTMLGYPPVAATMPLFVAAADKQPAFVLKSDKTENCEICDIALEVKKKAFSQHRGNGGKYVNFAELQNEEGSGLMQKAKRADAKTFNAFAPFVADYHKNACTLNVEEMLKLQNECFENYKSEIKK